MTGRRTGLGRHRRIVDSAGDPLDGLVNLFDIGIVLAVAFLIAGLGLTLNQSAHRLESRAPSATSIPQGTQPLKTLPSPASAPSASGHGQPVGTVYRLSNGQLVYVQKGTRP
ncbi:MAG TPA: DUF2149 domain-containing protein [Solirubrobacteraceae bacterium]|jgi:hypothetical protein|nr:DUF2149 domain-containing protein [Solirubrobacteraceae bacterium]